MLHHSYVFLTYVIDHDVSPAELFRWGDRKFLRSPPVLLLRVETCESLLLSSFCECHVSEFVDNKVFCGFFISCLALVKFDVTFFNVVKSFDVYSSRCF